MIPKRSRSLIISWPLLAQKSRTLVGEWKNPFSPILGMARTRKKRSTTFEPHPTQSMFAKTPGNRHAASAANILVIDMGIVMKLSTKSLWVYGTGTMILYYFVEPHITWFLWGRLWCAFREVD